MQLSYKTDPAHAGLPNIEKGATMDTYPGIKPTGAKEDPGMKASNSTTPYTFTKGHAGGSKAGVNR
jgi:hypothetical protein